MTDAFHTSVMTDELLTYLAPVKRNELMVDANLGEGGHSLSFLSKFPDLKIIGIDADSMIMAVAKQRLSQYGSRIHYYCGWSDDFFAQYPAEFKKPDKILIDSGVSLYHYRASGRGFSFENDEPLDMRLDTSKGIKACELIAKLPEKELADLIYNNSGERYSRRIASAIVKERKKCGISTSKALADIVAASVPGKYRHGKVHPATKTFMALRIAVNGELARLPELLEASLGVLEPGGRLGILSFHSAEDRIIKNFFKSYNKTCTCPEQTPICRCEGSRSINILTKKGVAPGKEEIERNPPSRSARLRVVEKCGNGVCE